MKEKIISILNVKKSESKYVFDLLTVQFFIGIANSFINIVVFTYFIYNYTITGLPYAYLSIGIILLLLNLVYQKIEHHFSPLKLLQLILISSAIIIALFWGGVTISSNYALVFLLLIWSTLFYMLTGYAFWGLVSILFNIRESKRIFSIVGAGDIPAKLIGYSTAPFLISIIGINNLLLLSVVSISIGIYLLNKLINNKSCSALIIKAHSLPKHFPALSKQENRLNSFFQNKLIFTISLLSIISYNVFTLTDFTFLSQIKINSFSISALSTFLAVFFAIGRFTAIILKFAFTSRVIERLGLFSCLLLTPVTLLIFCFILIAIDSGSHSTLYMFGIMALLAEVLRSTMQEPVFFILFQPLNENLRLKGHIIAKGYMLPPSLFIVGLLLILLPEFNINLSILLTVKILLINLGIWVITIFYIKKEYVKLLRASIAKGVFNSEEILFYDKKAIAILVSKIATGRESEIIYSLKLLENAKYQFIDNLLNDQLHNTNPEVKKYALSILDERGKLNIPTLKQLLDIEKSAEVREKIVSLLCKIDNDYLKTISDNILLQDNNIKKIVIIHLLNQSEFSLLNKASSQINGLLKSTAISDRELALNIITEVKNISFTDAIEELIKDSLVRRNAITAACKLRIQKCLPYIFNLLNNPTERYMVMQGLVQYGDPLFMDIEQLPGELINEHLSHLIKISGKVKGYHSTRFLLSRLDESSMTEKIIHSLWSKECQDELGGATKQLENLLELHLKRGIEKIKDYNSVPVFNDHDLVKDCIKSEIKNDLETSLKICSLLYKKIELNRVLELLMYNEKQKIYNAMEMLEMVLSKKLSMQINILFDKVMDPTYIRWATSAYDVKALFNKIIITHEKHFNIWTKAVCIYCSSKNNQLDLLEKVNKTEKENEILKETRLFVLNEHTH